MSACVCLTCDGGWSKGTPCDVETAEGNIAQSAIFEAGLSERLGAAAEPEGGAAWPPGAQPPPNFQHPLLVLRQNHPEREEQDAQHQRRAFKPGNTAQGRKVGIHDVIAIARFP